MIATKRRSIRERQWAMWQRLDVENHRESTFWERYRGPDDGDHDDACFWLMTGRPG